MFFAPKSADVRILRTPLVHKMSAQDKPPSPMTADVFYGWPLTRALQRIDHKEFIDGHLHCSHTWKTRGEN